VHIPVAVPARAVSRYCFFFGESTTIAGVFAVWAIAVSSPDVVPERIFPGRGAQAPIPVIPVGAIGGMRMSGTLGLFIGAVVLAPGCLLLEQWHHVHDAGGQTGNA
jgi:predicted PurR-regulated permease PerM